MTLREFNRWLSEFEQRLKERDQANKEAIKAAFASAEKASEKTERALTEYKVGANEWRDTVKDLIANLRESRSGTQGGKENTARFVTYAFLALAALQLLLKFLPVGQP